MGRSFASRLARSVEDLFEPEKLHDSEPENEYVTGAEPHPSEGDPSRGIPVYPAPLPGGHEYQGKEVVKPHRLDVPPPQAYYTGGMAHGVRSSEPHNGRIAPRGDAQHEIRHEPEHHPEVGKFKVEPIPVYVTEPGAGIHPLSMASFRQVTVTPGAAAFPIVERNPDRKSVLFLVESAAPGGVRLKNGPDASVGALLSAGMTSYREVTTQDQVWVVADAAAAAPQVVSVIEQYKQAR